MNDTVDEFNPANSETQRSRRREARRPPSTASYLLILALGILLGWMANDLAEGTRSSEEIAAGDVPEFATTPAQQPVNDVPLVSPPLPVDLY